MTQLQSLIDGGFNSGEGSGRVVWQREITHVMNGTWPAQVHAVFGPQITVAGVELFANGLRGLRRTAQVRRIRVEGNSQKRNGSDGWSRVGITHGIPV